MDSTDPNFKLILDQAAEGQKSANEKLWSLLHVELKKMASLYLRKTGSSETMRPTVIVNELYLKLLNGKDTKYQGKTHFLAVSAMIMRQLLIDYIRNKGSLKRGGNQLNLSFDESLHQRLGDNTEYSFEELNTALDRLNATDPQLYKIVELRFFGGLEIEEIAKYLEISPATVKRKWNTAKLWLYDELSSPKKIAAG